MTDHAEAVVRIRAELGDVMTTFRLADVLGVDLIQAANTKIDANDYRTDTYRGSARKAPRRHVLSPRRASARKSELCR